MKPLEIIIGAVVLLISIVLIVICMMQEQKPQNATAALTGASMIHSTTKTVDAQRKHV